MEATERLILIREALKLTVKEFAEKCQYEQNSYRNIESGSSRITEKFAQRLQKNAGVNPDFLLNGNEPMFINQNTTTNQTKLNMKIMSNEERIDRLLDQNDKLIEILHYQAATINNLSGGESERKKASGEAAFQ